MFGRTEEQKNTQSNWLFKYTVYEIKKIHILLVFLILLNLLNILSPLCVFLLLQVIILNIFRPCFGG